MLRFLLPYLLLTSWTSALAENPPPTSEPPTSPAPLVEEETPAPPVEQKAERRELPKPPPKVTDRTGPVYVIPLQGDVTEAQFFAIRRALKEAERVQARAVILDIDTYGGSLMVMIKILDALLRVEVPTYAYINPNAGSAGAVIALGTDAIFMAPVSAIGAAAPVSSGGEEIGKTMTEKTVSYFGGYARSAAERKGHNPELAEAFIDVRKEVKIGDRVISEKDKLLTLSAQDAVEVIDGRPVLSEAIVDNVAALAERKSPGTKVERFEPSGFENLSVWITKLAPILLMAGIAGIYIEIKTPGFGVPGLIGIVCLLIFFTGHYVAGLTGMEAFVVFFLGFILVCLEIFVLQGTILPGLVGAALMMAGLFWAMVDRYPADKGLPDSDQILMPLINLGIAGVLSAIVVAALSSILPSTPFFRKLVLTTSVGGGPSPSIGGDLDEPPAVSAGDEGVAATDLRPSGKVRVRGVVRDALAEGEALEKGTAIRVLAVRGSYLEVESASRLS